MANEHSNRALYAGVLGILRREPRQRWPVVLAELYHPDVDWNGPHPINSQRGLPAVMSAFWAPLIAALPDLERYDDIIIEGQFKGGDWIGATGHYTGTFMHDWLGIPATGKVINIRYGEFSRFENGKIVEVYIILDILDVMRQAGRWPARIPRARGSEERIPGPSTHDGIRLRKPGVDESEVSLKLVEAMIAGLMTYDGNSLDSMGMERFWNIEGMMWYGPAGIGTSRGLKGFQDVHQRAFLAAFPDRVGGNHKARIAHDAYVGSTGWPSIRATHLGPWMGVPASGKPITQRVMDFWRREGDELVENWVFIDQLDLLLQLGVDIMDEFR